MRVLNFVPATKPAAFSKPPSTTWRIWEWTESGRVAWVEFEVPTPPSAPFLPRIIMYVN